LPVLFPKQSAYFSIDSLRRPVSIDHPPDPKDRKGDKTYQNIHEQDVDPLDNNEYHTFDDLPVVDLPQTSNKETENCRHPRVLHPILPFSELALPKIALST